MTILMPECSVRPAIALAPSTDPETTMDAVLDALETDPRALGVGGLAYDQSLRQLSSTFQVEIDAGPALLERAHRAAAQIAADAIRSAGVDGTVVGVAVVEGDDPDRLP